MSAASHDDPEPHVRTPSRDEERARVMVGDDLLTPPTRRVLRERLDSPSQHISSDFFEDAAFACLRAVCARLIPIEGRPTPDELASCVDQRLHMGKSDGWRYDTMPSDGDAFVLGLRGVEETARARFDAGFADLPTERQDDVLRAVQCGEAEGETWRTLPSGRFFEELLAEVVESCYSHPVALASIDYIGMADARGWRRVGLNEREDWQPPSWESENFG